MAFASNAFATAAFAGVAAEEEAAAAAERVLLLSPRDSDAATMTASTSTSSLPVANVQNQEPTKVWRSTALPAHVDINLGSAKAVNAAAMSGFSLTQSGLWRLRAYAAAADIGGTAALDSGWRSVWPDNYKHGAPEWGPEVALLRLRNDAVYQYWRVEFADTGSTYMDVGRLAIGRALQFGINMDIEAGIGFARNDVQEPNGYGQIFTDPRPYAQRQFDMPWSALGQAESHDAAMELARLRGQAGDIFCFLDPAEVTNFHRWSMQGLFTGRADFRSRALWVTDSDGTARQAWGFTFNLIQKL